MNDALNEIARTGVMGALLVIALGAYYLKDKRLTEETQNRIKDGQETQKLLMQVQSSVIDAVHKLGEIVEWAEKRADEASRSLISRGGRDDDRRKP